MESLIKSHVASDGVSTSGDGGTLAALGQVAQTIAAVQTRVDGKKPDNFAGESGVQLLIQSGTLRAGDRFRFLDSFDVYECLAVSGVSLLVQELPTLESNSVTASGELVGFLGGEPPFRLSLKTVVERC